ncbi:MAG: hypothetical protein QE277_12175 [Flectobacillus sp.]|nr:hypothetical protein [Flectobacillus sp.]
MKGKQPKEYKIKIPVYVSELIDKPMDMFGGITKLDMIKSIKDKLSTYNDSVREIKRQRRNKTFEKHIKGINYDEIELGDTKALLLRITSFNTNYLDGFFEEEKKIVLTKKAKIGSDNNFILIYPNIYSLAPEKYRYQWIFLLYEDPNKESSDVIGTAKIVLKDILNIEVKNIKLNTVIEALRDAKVTPLVELKITTLDFDIEDNYPKLKNYITSRKVKTIDESIYENLPSEDAIDLITFGKNFFRKGYQVVKRFILGNKEFKITQTYEDANEKIKEVVEEIYNSETTITEDELQNELYETDFVLGKLVPILSQYLNNKDED